MEKIMTVDEVATLLSLHPFTVLGYIRQGRLRAAKLGRIYRVTESELGRFIAEAMAHNDQRVGAGVISREEKPAEMKKLAKRRGKPTRMHAAARK